MDIGISDSWMYFYTQVLHIDFFNLNFFFYSSYSVETFQLYSYQLIGIEGDQFVWEGSMLHSKVMIFWFQENAKFTIYVLAKKISLKPE